MHVESILFIHDMYKYKYYMLAYITYTYIRNQKYNATFSSPVFWKWSLTLKKFCLQFLSRQILWLWLHGSDASNRATWGEVCLRVF